MYHRIYSKSDNTLEFLREKPYYGSYAGVLDYSGKEIINPAIFKKNYTPKEERSIYNPSLMDRPDSLTRYKYRIFRKIKKLDNNENFYWIENEKYKIGIMTFDGQIKIAPIYSNIYEGESKGNMVLEAQEKLYNLDKDFNLTPTTKKGEPFSLYSGRIPNNTLYLADFHENLAIVFNGENFGYCDSKGNIIIAPQYNVALNFTSGVALVKKGSKWGIIDKTGKEIMPCIMNNAAPFSEDLSVIERVGKFGAVNTKGEQIIPFNYDALSNFRNGFAKYYDAQKDKFGLIDKQGKVMFEPKFTNLTDFEQGIAFAVNENQFALIDTKGKELTPYKYLINQELDNPEPLFHEGWAAVGKRVEPNNFINLQGKELLLQDEYDWVDYFSEGLAPVMKNGKFGYINTEGKLVISLQFDETKPFYGAYAAVKMNNAWGFINKKGEVVVAPNFDEVGIFKEGLAAAQLSGRWGYIKENGDLAIPFIFNQAENFKNTMAKVRLGETYIFIDKYGKTVLSEKIISDESVFYNKVEYIPAPPMPGSKN